MERRMTPEERVAWLLNLGLTDGEARSYLALLDGGPAPASDVAKRAKVPRNRVYDVLESLAAKDLVDIRLETVRTFAARPVDRFLADRRAGLARKRASLEEKRGQLRGLFGAPASRASDEPAGVFKVVRGRRDATDALARLLRTAERRVLVSTTVTTLTRIDNHASGSEVLPALLARGVEVRIAASGDGEPPAELAATVRRTPSAQPAHRFVVDDREVAYLLPATDDDRVYVGDDRLLLTDAPALVREAAELVDAAWNGLVEPPGTWDADEARAMVLATVDAARSSVLVVGRELAVTLAHAMPTLEKAARRGARVRVVLDVGPDHVEVGRRLARVAEVRHVAEPGLGLLAADAACVQVVAGRHHRPGGDSPMLLGWAESLWDAGTPLGARLEGFNDDARTVAVRAVESAGLPALVGARPAKVVLASGAEADTWARPGHRLVLLGDAGPRAGAADPPLLLGMAVVGDHAYFWPYRRRGGKAVPSETLVEVQDDRLVGALEERFESLDG